ncbi:acyl-CoA dehydrogenase family protein [Rhodococcus aetherivorans]
MSATDALHPPVLFAPEHEEFAQWVREFAAPHAESYLERAHREEFPWDLAEKMAAQGLLGLGVSEENGGQGRIGEVLTKTHLGIAHEELAYANFYLSQLAYTNDLTGPLLERFLAPDVAKDWVRGIVEGRHVVALGLTEPGSGSDAMAMRAKAEKVDGGWKLNGEKTSITFAPHAKAMITFVKARGATPEESGVTAFLVPLDSDGVSMQKFPDAGWKPLGRAGVFLDDVFVPDEYVIGGVGNGFRLVMSEFDYTRSVIGLMSTGVARKALDITIDYVKSRKAFGKPVASFQGVSFPIAENATKLEAARWLTYRALSRRRRQALHEGGRDDQALRHRRLAADHPRLHRRPRPQRLRRGTAAAGHAARRLRTRDRRGHPQIQKVVIGRALLGREATA